MNVILVFTFGVSLKDWFESGLLSREIRIYEEILQKEDIQFSFITPNNFWFILFHVF